MDYLFICIFITIILLSCVVRHKRENYHSNKKCSGSGCTFYDNYGYYRNFEDYYEYNIYPYYRYQYPYYRYQYPYYRYQYPYTFF